MSYYSAGALQRPLYAGERPPSLPPPAHQQAYSSSGTASPRVSSVASSASSNADSQSSYTSAASSLGPKTPPSIAGQHSQPHHHHAGGYDHYPAMNQGATPAEMYYQHMSAGQAAPPQTVTSSAMSYHPQQPTLLPPSAGSYPGPTYSGYAYPNGLTPPPTGGPGVSGPMGTGPVLPLPGVPTQVAGMQPGYQQPQQTFDQTGQVAPPGMKPRVTATLWEDEGSLCFQVEAKGICVARREGVLLPSSGL